MNDYDVVFEGLGVQIEFQERETFSKIRETLTRIGIASSHKPTLYQTAHILHKRSMYGILHFKEMFLLDGKEAILTQEDYDRRNQIVNYLQDWGLVTTPVSVMSPRYTKMTGLRVISHKDKANWELIPKYSIGSRRT